MSSSELSADEKLFFNSVMDFAQATDGEEGLQKLQTKDGLREYSLKYLAANQLTLEKFLNSSRIVQHQIKTAIMRTVYDRIQFQVSSPQANHNKESQNN